MRARVRGSAERPRISVFRSNRGIFAQLIDDDAGRTIAAVGGSNERVDGGVHDVYRLRAYGTGIGVPSAFVPPASDFSG